MRDVRTIRSVDWTHQLGSFGDVVENLDDIHQCIRVICSTPKGTDPLRPEFALAYLSLIDKPVNIVEPELVTSVIEAIRLYEPRVTVTRVEVYHPDLGHVGIRIHWILKSGGAEHITEVEP